jgi:putative endonuclease
MPVTLYIATNKNLSILFTGITDNLKRRMQDHKSKKVPEPLKKFEINKLVYTEEHQSLQDALMRELSIRAMPEDQKIEMIMKKNPKLKDLS